MMNKNYIKKFSREQKFHEQSYLRSFIIKTTVNYIRIVQPRMRTPLFDMDTCGMRYLKRICGYRINERCGVMRLKMMELKAQGARTQ